MGRKAWGWALAATFAAVSQAGAAQELERQFPANATYCESSSNALPTPTAYVETLAGGAQVNISPALVIHDQSMRTIVSSLLPQSWKGMCAFGIDGSLEKVWLLSDWQARRQSRKAQAKADAAAAASGK